MRLIPIKNLGIRMADEFSMKGFVVEGHAHNFDHLTYVPHGSFLVEGLSGPGGEVVWSKVVSSHDRYNWVAIPANRWHRLTALEDNSEYHCIYLHRDEEGIPMEKYNTLESSYE